MSSSNENPELADSPQKLFEAKFLDCAAAGQVDDIRLYIKGMFYIEILTLSLLMMTVKAFLWTV